MSYKGKQRLLIWFIGVVVMGLILTLTFYRGGAQAAPSEGPLLGITPTATMTTATPEPPTPTPALPTATPESPTATPTSPAPTVTPSPTTPPEPEVPGQVERVDPAIVKLVDPQEALPNEQVDFTIQVTNKGTVAAVGVVVTDQVSEYLEILDVETTQGTVQVTGQLVVVNVGVVGPDFVVDIVIRTRVRGDAPAPLDIENLAILTADNAGERRARGTLKIPDAQLPVTGEQGGSGIGLLAVVVALIAVIGLAIWESRKSSFRSLS